MYDAVCPSNIQMSIYLTLNTQSLRDVADLTTIEELIKSFREIFLQFSCNCV